MVSCHEEYGWRLFLSILFFYIDNSTSHYCNSCASYWLWWWWVLKKQKNVATLQDYYELSATSFLRLLQWNSCTVDVHVQSVKLSMADCVAKCRLPWKQHMKTFQIGGVEKWWVFVLGFYISRPWGLCGSISHVHVTVTEVVRLCLLGVVNMMCLCHKLPCFWDFEKVICQPL